MSRRRGVLTGHNKMLFDRNCRRQNLAGRKDVVITAMSYLRAAKITVVTKTQLMRALIERNS